jgi:hypothetical protein
MPRPPALDVGRSTVRAAIERGVLSLPGVSRRKSRFGDSESYFVGDREIAHFHGDEQMDVRLTKEAIQQLRATGAIDPRMRPRGSSAEWLRIVVKGAADVVFAVELVEQAARNNG